MWRSACADAVTDGATSCMVVELDSSSVVEGVDAGGLEGAPALIELLAGRAPLGNAFARAHGAPATPVRETLVVGGEHAVFAAIDAQRSLAFLVALPRTTSVALGWAILRRLASGGAP